jgi:RNA polymerase sigma-70 factor (ECF subfamily)
MHLQRNVAMDKDMRSYRKLFIFFSAPLIQFAISIVKSREAAEEIYSDVMLKIWNLGTALNNIGNLKAYLYTSVKRACLKNLSKNTQAQFVDIDSVDVDVFQAHNTMDNILIAEFNKQVYASIKSLPPKCQLVYKLIKEDGFNYKEVSDILEISLKTVEGHMTKALRTIHACTQHYLRSGEN